MHVSAEKTQGRNGSLSEGATSLTGRDMCTTLSHICHSLSSMHTSSVCSAVSIKLFVGRVGCLSFREPQFKGISVQMCVSRQLLICTAPVCSTFKMNDLLQHQLQVSQMDCECESLRKKLLHSQRKWEGLVHTGGLLQKNTTRLEQQLSDVRTEASLLQACTLSPGWFNLSYAE